MLYTLSRNIIVLFLKLGFKFKVIGKENIPRKGGVILAANHTSYLDPPALGSASTRKVFFMARNTLFRNRLLGIWMRSIGVIPLGRHEAHPSALKDALAVVKKGNVLGLFPEGTRSLTGHLGKPHPGIAFIAGQTGVPVVPVFISGTDKVLPKNARGIKFSMIMVRFGKPIHISKEVPYERSAELIMAQIARLASS